MSKNFVNELRPELVGIHGLSPLSSFNSASRNYMFSSHIGQRLSLDNPDSKTIVSGVENKFAKYTFDIRMPEDGKIIKIIKRYPEGVGLNALRHNPQTLVVYESEKDRTVNCFSIKEFTSYHQTFGFQYRHTDKLSLLSPGRFIPKDTVFSTPPSVGENSEFMMGVNPNVAFMGIPSVSEDGIMVSEDYLEKLSFHTYERRSNQFGASKFPLNLYGDANTYKPFPEIGDYVREDGVLMALRDYDTDLSITDMSVFTTREIDHTFDTILYTKAGKGKVVDIRVINNPGAPNKTPSVIKSYVEKYSTALKSFYKELTQLDNELRFESKRRYGTESVRYGEELHRQLVEAYSIMNVAGKRYRQPLNLLYRNYTLDEYMVEFVIEYKVTPTKGFKLSDFYGGL